MFVLNEANSVVLKMKRKVFGNATGTLEDESLRVTHYKSNMLHNSITLVVMKE